MLVLIVLIFIIGLLVFVHEFGHFITAKKAGCRVLEFGFGFPPRIFSVKKGETTYSLNLIPLGGFVKIFGEEGEGKEDKRSFAAKSVSKRALILFSGVAMNFVLAFFLFSLGAYIGSPEVVDSGSDNIKVHILNVSKNSPAEEAGIKMGDIVLKINGNDVKNYEDVKKYVSVTSTDKINVLIERGGKAFEKEAIFRKNPPSGEGSLGVELVQTGIVRYPPLTALWVGLKTTFLMTTGIFIFLYELIKELFITGTAEVQVAGPVGIAVMTGEAIKMGISYLIQFVAVLSVNLAVINILPFPALDGGRILFLGIEKIIKRKVSPSFENAVHTFGFILLIILMIAVTFKDISRSKEIFASIINKLK